MISPADIPGWAYPAAGGVAVAAVLAWIFLLWSRRRAIQRIEATIDSVAYDVLRNVLIPNGMDGQITLQYLLLTERGLLVVDLLERPGSIFGGDQMVEWTSIGKKRRYTFRNPQHVLYDRIAAVKLLANNTPVDGRVVFTLRSEFPKGKSTYVMRIDDLVKEYPIVDRNRGNVVAAFANVWSHVKKNAQPASMQ
jgi:Nuclease-related domain